MTKKPPKYLLCYYFVLLTGSDNGRDVQTGQRFFFVYFNWYRPGTYTWFHQLPGENERNAENVDEKEKERSIENVDKKKD